jgi:CRISPR-associated protein Csb1
MAVDVSKLLAEPRFLLKAELTPVAGQRFQPTGFPDLGPAEYEAPGKDGQRGTPMLLVESAQSMANRLEAVCWDEGNDDLVESLHGLPYVKARLPGLGEGHTTSSLLEFHRLNSPYLIGAVRESDKRPFRDVLIEELGLSQVKAKKASPEVGQDDAGEGDEVAGVINLRRLAKTVFKYDPNSLIHGIFLEKIAGRLRLPRLLSAFIEAEGVKEVASGGVKFDRVDPRGDAAQGYGNVPYSRKEFVAQRITAYFHLDLAQLRGSGLPDDARALLACFGLWKVLAFLDPRELRLRTACILEAPEKPHVERLEKGFALPSLAEVEQELKARIKACSSLFADPPVTVLVHTAPEKKPGKKAKQKSTTQGQ